MSRSWSTTLQVLIASLAPAAVLTFVAQWSAWAGAAAIAIAITAAYAIRPDR